MSAALIVLAWLVLGVIGVRVLRRSVAWDDDAAFIWLVLIVLGPFTLAAEGIIAFPSHRIARFLDWLTRPRTRRAE